ncbi:MAG: DUF2726 domain-containing protein [Planctomycetota bacterium]
MSGPEPLESNAGCLGRLVQVLFGDAPTPADGPWPYRRKKHLLSKAELNFYRVLLPIVTQRGWTVCPKVNLNDLLYLAKGTGSGTSGASGGRMAWLNKINRKHADFVLCDATTMSPLLVIELDDASHHTKAAQARDAAKDRALKAAGLPLLRVPATRSYDLSRLAKRLDAMTLGVPLLGTANT